MRWGIPSDAYEYHGTYDLCKKEIADCQKFSIGPNFVVIIELKKILNHFLEIFDKIFLFIFETLIGQKYGLRPLIVKIQAEEFEILKNELTTKFKDLSVSLNIENELNEPVSYYIENVLEKCYKLDTNATPNVYCLQK